MTRHLNCWEFKNCGREPGGVLAESLGVCPVALEMKHDGDNEGRAAGRVCWKTPIEANGRQSLKSCVEKSCHQCSFYRRLRFEESAPREGQHRLIVAGREIVSPEETQVIEVA